MKINIYVAILTHFEVLKIIQAKVQESRIHVWPQYSRSFKLKGMSMLRMGCSSLITSRYFQIINFHLSN